MRSIVLSGLVAFAAASTPNCLSTTLATYNLSDTPLDKLNPWLASDEAYTALRDVGCPDDRSDGAVCFDKPAIGSGLAQLPPFVFLGLTDRGPNQDCEDLVEFDSVKYADASGKKGKGFPLPRFAPTMTHFEVADDATIKPVKYVPLQGADMQPITGLPNTARDDTPYGPNCAGDVLEYDPSGLDTEDLAVIPGTEYVAIVDEYSPSVVIANYNTGVITSRHVPTILAEDLKNASYPIVGDIPAVFANRRKNRGFEAVVVDKHAKYVIAILQSPMLGEDDANTRNNVIIRAAYFAVSMSKYNVPTLAYKKSFVIEGSSPSAYENKSNKAKDIKYSGAQYLSEHKFIALERAKGQVKLFLVDFERVTNIDDTKYADNLGLESETNGEKTVAQLGIVAAEKTLVWDSASVVGGSVDFTGSSKQEGFVVDVNDPTKVWMLNDNDFGLEGNGPVEMRELALGRSLAGATVCGMPDHPPTPIIDLHPTKTIQLVNSQTYRISSEPGAGAAENFDIDEVAQRAYVANDDTGAIDMYDVSVLPASPLSSYLGGKPYKPTSVSVCKSADMIAAAFANDEDDSSPGRIDVLTKDLKLFRRIKELSCFLPDSIQWSDDCKFLVAACEGEGAAIPGGVLIADFGSVANSSRFRGAVTADFKPYDSQIDAVRRNGVRLIESNVPSVDFEPEYVTINGKNAFITLQEANAIAVVDLYEGKITELKPIGFIDRSRPGFALDASNKDDGIRIKNYPFLYGMPQPDTITTYVAGDGKTYLVFANEGDSKDDAEEARGGDITDPEKLNRVAVPGLKELVEDKTALGRLKFSTIMGYNASTNTQEKMFHFGSRSFSIMAMDGTIVFDSGEWFARIQAKYFPAIFNANGLDIEDLSTSQADLFDDRYVTVTSHPFFCIQNHQLNPYLTLSFAYNYTFC